jgi:hypothetical protein
MCRILGVALVAAPLFVLAGCHRDRGKSAEVEKSAESLDPSLASHDSTRTLGPGDIRIENADSTIELALIGEKIVTGLGTKVIDKVKRATDTAAVTGTGFGSSIERMVKSTVQTAMSKEVTFPLASFQDVRYEGGRLEFYGTDGKKSRFFQDSHEKGKPISETFRPADAERFVAAFHARKHGT